MNKHYLTIIACALTLMLAVGILLVNVSIPGKIVEGCLEGCAQPADERRTSLRILSLNVLHGRPDFEGLEERLSLIASEIERLGVDIALLQEVPWTREHGSAAAYLAEQTGMNSAYLRANGNRHLIGFEEGVMVLSRYPLVLTEFYELQPQAGFFEHRVVLHGTAQTSSGAIDLYVTHLTNGVEKTNQAQTKSLLEYVNGTARQTALVAGDFNAQESSPQMRSLRQRWVDAFRAANSLDPGLTCCIEDLSAPPDTSLNKRIDYIYIVPADVEQLNITKAQVVFDQPVRYGGAWLWASDHAGVLVDIED